MRPRKLTLVPLIAAVYFVVAGGPFGIEEIVSKSGYTRALAILLLTPIVWSFPTALMVSELASALPDEGGYYVWVGRGLGRFWGFQEAWLSLAGSIFDMALYPTLFVGYFGHFAPGRTAGGHLWVGVALIAAAAAWNLLGARTVGTSSTAVGIAMLAPFAAVTAWALFRHGGDPAPAAHLPRVDILGGILIAMWNYMGWDNVSTVAGEVERPRRNYPLAMAGAVAVVAASYALPVAAIALTGLGASRWSEFAWPDVASAVFHGGAAGSAIAAAIALGGMIGAACSLNALTMCLSRLPAVMAEDGYLPKPLARRLPRTGAPWVAILVCAAAWALCLQLSFMDLISLDMLLSGGSVLLEFAALVALRIREPELPRPYRIPGGLAAAIGVGIFPLALLVVAVVRNGTEPVGPIDGLQLGVLLIALGIVAYWLGERFRKHDRR